MRTGLHNLGGDKQRYGQDVYPARLQPPSARSIIDIPLKLILIPFMLIAFPLFAIMAPLMLMNQHTADAAFPYLLFVLWAAAIILSFSYRIASFYNTSTSVFTEEKSILGKRLSINRWPKHLFKGISYGSKGIYRRGAAIVIRLVAHQKGQLVDGFLYAED